MKYSVLSIAALVAPALGNPAYYWRHYLSGPIHLANAGTVYIQNKAPFDVDVDVEPQGDQFHIPPGQHHSVPGAPVADVKFNQQVEMDVILCIGVLENLQQIQRPVKLAPGSL
ncbi:hypothetical protein ALT_2709 [Aspergillus lentulus]|uniref:Uncharacterized protein n=1 Tax=Aspergillus lentulus TaxID=293939 RepID=A0AAN4PFR9_ASPLE|nr:hypothetical protein CNMCM7927_009732 [Aspergillus lentulus]GAQ05388.1 hypothetical protein ALT_2709 [Aspergillus lentulus]GFF75082.1 hypothetical protein IFM62136_08982 [Aspergillus lentulus]GFF93617.1 hypothetical protein IFM60648_10143 [Aspergillus lentulus]GFF96714.1 hypothetical protein IFM47457_11023 [Aspergillus lentulus]